ncbi:GTA-gp10 family protein [Pseudaestuariivita rosea]|uniref:GTA-gp10 family protein n=1 Tax=Pseudaestuariivita rosea TaxID=2763263 RepID=UPI001ABB09E7|nr:GTA-gp10 family protein [Pseudaestuariivita rosea]
MSLQVLELGGERYVMRPSYQAMRDIEARSDLTIAELLDLALAGRLKIEEAVIIFWCACEAGGAGFSSMEALGKAIFELRLTAAPVREALVVYLTHCLYAPAEAKKKLDTELLPHLATEAAG